LLDLPPRVVAGARAVLREVVGALRATCDASIRSYEIDLPPHAPSGAPPSRADAAASEPGSPGAGGLDDDDGDTTDDEANAAAAAAAAAGGDGPTPMALDDATAAAGGDAPSAAPAAAAGAVATTPARAGDDGGDDGGGGRGRSRAAVWGISTTPRVGAETQQTGATIVSLLLHNDDVHTFNEVWRRSRNEHSKKCGDRFGRIVRKEASGKTNLFLGSVIPGVW